MIISDLNHLEVVSEETNVVGGRWKYFPSALAESAATATAIGTVSQTYTVTNSEAVAGLFSSSSSYSGAEAKG